MVMERDTGFSSQEKVMMVQVGEDLLTDRLGLGGCRDGGR